VTNAIKELEDSLGTQLFVRMASGVALTQTGRKFLNQAYTILSSVEEAMRIPNLESTLSGTLTIAASYTVIGYFLPHHLQRLSTLYPLLTINLHELNRESIEEGLITERYDMAVLLTSNVANPELVLEPVIHSARRLWLCAHHPLLKRESVMLADVAPEPFVMLTVDEAAYTALRYWADTPHRPNVKLRTSSVEAVRSMVANGSGVAILSDMVYRPWSLEGKRIETVVLRDPVPPMSVGLAWRKNREFSPGMHAVREYFRHTFMEPRSVASNL
jgi:DNA-binding transcriptional LysR family regulator